jgi:hypothetical protein
VGNEHPQIVLGSLVFTDVRCLLRASGEELFSILQPELKGAPYRLSAKMANTEGKVIFEIHQNEWKIRSDNWDAQQEGQRIVVRNAPRDIALSIRSEPPTRLVIERLDMQWKGVKIEAREGTAPIAIFDSGARVESPSMSISGADVGIDVTDTDIRIASAGGSVTFGPGTMLNSGPPTPDRQPFSPVRIR